MTYQKLNILIADSQFLFIECLQYLFKHNSLIEIGDFALNGKEAIEKSKSKHFDIIIMDIDMPVIDGIQATGYIKNLYPAIKIIILSATTDLNKIINALNAGADAYVLKNTNSLELMKAFQKVSKNEIYLSSSITHFFPKKVNKENKVGGFMHSLDNFITNREKGVLRLITEGYTNQRIAEILFISVKTADTHRKNLLAKFKVSNTASLVRFAVENKLI